MSNKKVLGTVVGIIAFLVCIPFVIHNSLTDRFNPTIPEIVSYAKVSKGTQKYRSVQAFNPKDGQDLSYKIRFVGGYDPTRQYISIDHKGQYVRKIDYISKKKFLDARKNN